MTKKSKTEFINDEKPDEAVYAISLDHSFAWAMMTNEGKICSSGHADVTFSGDKPFSHQIGILLSELYDMQKLVDKIGGIVLRLPKIQSAGPDIAMQKVMAIGLIKAFCLKHEIDLACMQPSEISESAVSEALKIMKSSCGLSSLADGKHEAEISALEALLTTSEKMDDDAGTDGDDEEDVNVTINILMAGAV